MSGTVSARVPYWVFAERLAVVANGPWQASLKPALLEMGLEKFYVGEGERRSRAGEGGRGFRGSRRFGGCRER